MDSTRAVRYCRCGTRLARDNTDTLCSPCWKKRQDAALSPPDVPPEFWETDQLRDALANWHMGRVVYAYRAHPFHGPRPLPQELVAGWFGITQTQLSRIENGPPIQDLDRLIRWAQTLGIPAHLLWFKLPAQRPIEESSTATKEAEDMQRNEFLWLAGSTLANLLVPPLAHVWPSDNSPPAPELTDVLLNQIRAQTEGFRWLDRKDGAYKHLPATAQHARNLIRLWRLTDDTHPLRAQLAEVAADACHLVAYQAFDQGQRTPGIEWYRCAAELASRSASQDLYVLAVCGVASMHARNGDAELAFSMLRQLSSLRLSAAARCYIGVHEALIHARARRLDFALKAFDHAAAFSEQTGNEVPSSWLGIPDSSFVERMRASVFAQFGKTGAITLLNWLDQSTPAVFHRYRVHLATDRALISAHQKQVEPSAESLISALILNQQAHSVEKARRILAVRELLDPYRDSKAVQAVDEVIQTTKARELVPSRSTTVHCPGPTAI
jgi:transcriptional regulator with XRE-family HTH domain